MTASPPQNRASVRHRFKDNTDEIQGVKHHQSRRPASTTIPLSRLIGIVQNVLVFRNSEQRDPSISVRVCIRIAKELLLETKCAAAEIDRLDSTYELLAD
jgi:hypothetical protein